MILTHHRWRLLVTCLALASVLFRGMIPTGFMPTAGVHGAHGGMLMPCPGGDMASMQMPSAPGQPEAPVHHSVIECPFAASAVPVLPAVSIAYAALRFHAAAHVAFDVASVSLASIRIRPPARAPPKLS